MNTIDSNALARALYLEQAKQNLHRDDPLTPEQRWDKGFPYKELWLQRAERLLAGLSIRTETEIRAEVEAEVFPMIRDLVDPDPCWFDHHGGCQAHGYLSLEPGEICPHEEAKQWLKEKNV